MKKSRRVLALLLSLAVAVGMAPMTGAVFAADEPDSDTSTFDELALQLQTDSDPFAFTNEADGEKAVEDSQKYPESFDLRNVDTDNDGTGDTSYVTPVKFQNPFGSCWGFAAIAAAETSILGSNLAQQDGYGVVADPGNGIKELDLSEKHLINFFYRPLVDSDDPQNGEGMVFKNKNLTLEDKFDYGGLPFYATSLFSAGIGPNLEDRTVDEGLPQNIYEYHGLESEIQISKVDGKWADYCYSDEDDWSLPESLRFKQSYMLKNSYLLPSPVEITEAETAEEGITEQYTYNPAGTAAIKDQLMHKRAVEIGFCADASTPNQIVEGQYISKNWAHYTYEPEGANHAVTIVGWDDNYDRSNFVAGHEPPADMFPDGKVDGAENGGNGAWLVKNSWGSGEREFPNRGRGTWGIENDEGVHTGYFWISYYDQSISLPEALEFDKSNVGQEYYLDQHDYMPVSEVDSGQTKGETRMANVFKAEVTQELRQISFQTAAPKTTVNYEIYLLTPDFKTPQDGVMAASGTVKGSGEGASEELAYGGFHKADLDKPVIIQKDQSYSIILTMTTPEGEYSFNMPLSEGQVIAETFGMPHWMNAVVNPKESFIKLDGAWYDYTDMDMREKLLGGTAFLMALDNFPIKGFCWERKNQPRLSVLSGNTVNLELVGGEAETTDTMVVAFKGSASSLPEDPEISWKLTDGSEKIIKITPDAADTSKCTVESLNPGTAYVAVTAEGIGTQVIRVNVSKFGRYDYAYDITVKYGKSMKAQVTDLDGKPITGVDFTYTSKNPKIAKVSPDGTVTGVGVGETTITATDEIGAAVEIPARVSKAVQGMTAKGKTVKLKAKKLEKKNASIKKAKALTVKKSKGKVTYKKVKVNNKKYNKKFTVNSKTGTITVKKGLKKGTYKLTVQVKAAGDKNYKAKTKKATVKIVVE